ncbi:MAG TPA: aldehyde dehydrogenase family protein [Bryobacteraceae bacterium]|nr:aldehyde dehydrogenase family protein [Bryobacteraceae bacterium]
MGAAVEAPAKLDIETRLFIGGEFVDSAAGGRIQVLNPHDNSLLAEVSEARHADVDRAVEAARRAFPVWKRMSAAERGRLLLKLADAIEADAEYLAKLETLDTGHPIRDTRGLDAPRTAATFRYYAGMADKIDGRVAPVEAGFLNYITREPVGVVGQIVPWNFPLMFTGWKLGPALAAGNTVVLKPAELTPLTTLRVAHLIAKVGIPPGVVNIVPGYGHVAGQYLAEHPGVDKIAFTGSTVTGKKIVQASAGNLKRVQLELGGKGANIVFDDAHIEAAVNGSAFAIFHNQGQACIAGSRLLLHEKIADEFLERFLALTKSIRVGDPLDPQTEMGPLTSPGHRERVINYIKIAREQGSTVLTGGKAPSDSALQAGCYIEPTVVTAQPTDRICQEEVFGPFVSITRFKDEAEVVGVANSTMYGLGGGLWTRDLQRAHRVAAAMQSGMVWINTYKRVNPNSPFGGVGQSGYGRDLGLESMQEYTYPKSVWVNVDANVPPFYKR